MTNASANNDMLDSLRDLYQDLILDHGRAPRNFRALPAATHDAVGHNPLCGDRLHLFLTLDAQGQITDAAFQGQGCAISTASASIMTEMLKGQTANDAERLFTHFHALSTGAPVTTPGIESDAQERLSALAGVRHYPVRVKCATLPWHTLAAALKRGNAASTE